MTAITAELQTERVEELTERHRVARLIAVSSASFTAVIIIVATILAAAA